MRPVATAGTAGADMADSEAIRDAMTANGSRSIAEEEEEAPPRAEEAGSAAAAGNETPVNGCGNDDWGVLAIAGGETKMQQSR